MLRRGLSSNRTASGVSEPVRPRVAVPAWRCRGASAGCASRDHIEVWLIDSAGPARKPNLEEDFRSQVCRGQRNDERLREMPEPGVVVLITQKTRE